MPKKTKYIRFEQMVDGAWDCINIRSNGTLGEITYYPVWKRNCFFPDPGTVFSQDCLEDIIDFMKQLKEEG